MENLFLEKNFVQKLIIAVIVIVLFNFSAPTIANAKSWKAKAVESIGGELLPPVMNLFVTIADAVLNALQYNLMDDVEIVVDANSGELKDTKRILEGNRKSYIICSWWSSSYWFGSSYRRYSSCCSITIFNNGNGCWRNSRNYFWCSRGNGGDSLF